MHPVRVEQSSVGSRETACWAYEQVRVTSEGPFPWPDFNICKMISSPNPTPSQGSKLCLPYPEETGWLAIYFFYELTGVCTGFS